MQPCSTQSSFSFDRMPALPSSALRALEVLNEAGYAAWIVGGWVRDALLGRPSHDVDITTDALWHESADLFRKAGYQVFETGTKHGTITVYIDSIPLEITTFRFDGVYSDGRHPDDVAFSRNLSDDLSRRDFTINALAYHPSLGIHDEFDGLADLSAGIIRAIGDPAKRFDEDALRILRACRFSSQLGFTIDEATWNAMLRNKCKLRFIAFERIRDELEGLILGPYAHDAIMRCCDVLTFVLPELAACKGLDQRTRYHIFDVLEHTAWAVQNAPCTPLSRWSALLHDLGKPGAFFIDSATGTGHFYGHASISARMAHDICNRLRFPTGLAHDVQRIVELHDDPIPETPTGVKRLLMRLDGNVELLRALLDMKRADASAQSPETQSARLAHADAVSAILEQVLAEKQAFSLADLRIDGKDVLDLGIKPGPAVGEALHCALDAVVEGTIENEAAALKAFVAANYSAEE